MNYIKVKLDKINVGIYGIGSVVEMEQPTAEQLAKDGLITVVPLETPFSINAPKNDLVMKVRVPKQNNTYMVSRGASTAWTTTTTN